MRVSPEILVMAFENGWQVHRKQRVFRNVERHIQILRVIQMKRFCDERQMKSNRQDDEDEKISSHLLMKYNRSVSPLGRR